MSVYWPPWTPWNRSQARKERLVDILDEARREDDAPVEVFALDALARIAAAAGDTSTARDLGDEADRRMELPTTSSPTSTEPTPTGSAERLSN